MIVRVAIVVPAGVLQDVHDGALQWELRIAQTEALLCWTRPIRMTDWSLHHNT